MRIGLLTTGYPRFAGDVAGHFVRGFADTLHRAGHTVEVLAPEPRRPPEAPGGEPGPQVRWLPYMRPRLWANTFYGAGAPDNLTRSLRARAGAAGYVGALSVAARAGRPRWDAVVSHWALPCGLVGAALDRPHLCVMHSGDLHLLCSLPGARALAWRIARPQTRLWFVAGYLRDRFLSLLPDATAVRVARECHTGPMGVALSASPARPRPRREGLRVVSLARLVDIKGLDLLVRAVAGRTDIELVIGGEGPERERLSQLAASLGVRLALPGTVGGADKARLLAEADVFAMPSRVLPSGRAEGCPTAILEAMDAGLPVVAARSGGIAELVAEDRTGLLHAPGDVAGLRTQLERLASSASLRGQLGAEGARRARRHGWDALAPVMQRMLGAAGAAPTAAA